MGEGGRIPVGARCHAPSALVVNHTAGSHTDVGTSEDRHKLVAFSCAHCGPSLPASWLPLPV